MSRRRVSNDKLFVDCRYSNYLFVYQKKRQTAAAVWQILNRRKQNKEMLVTGAVRSAEGLSPHRGHPPRSGMAALPQQGTGLPCRLGRRFKAFHALRSPPETRAPLRPRRRKVRFVPFPPDSENCTRSLAPPLPT